MRARLDPPRRRDARGSPACRCWPPRPTPRCRRRCARLGTLLGRPARGRRSCCWRCTGAGERAWVPLVPIALATGWSALVLFALRRAAEPDVGDAGRARDRDLDRVPRAADRALPRGARGRARAGDGAAAHLPLDRRGRARVRRDGDRRLRRARALGRPDAARLRARHGRRPHRLAARRAGRAARGADAGRAARRRRAAAPRRRRRRARSRPSRRERAAARGRPPGTSRYTWIVGRRARARARLHHAQHARAPTRRLARRPERARAAAVRGAAGARDARRRRQRARTRAAGNRPPARCAGRRSSTRASWRERGPVVLAFFATRSKRCERQVDVLERLAPRFPDVGVRRRGGPRRPRAAARARPRARVGDAGRLRPRRRGGERLRGGGLPDGDVRASAAGWWRALVVARRCSATRRSPRGSEAR